MQTNPGAYLGGSFRAPDLIGDGVTDALGDLVAATGMNPADAAAWYDLSFLAGMCGDTSRQDLALRSGLAGDVLLLAVAGGVFAEGVDYPGEMLRAVAVVGPCLPAVSLEQELLKLYYQERFERGFEYAFVVPGMTRVVQAAGRLIRSAEETGVIALFDRRFLAAPYSRHLPADWLPPEGPAALVGDPGEAASRFFASDDSQPSAGG